MGEGDDNQIKRGAIDPNPLQEPELVLWRGTAEGVEPSPHETKGFYHDLGQGLYLTADRWLAEEYARLRSSESHAPIVYRATLSRRLLGSPERTLDLTSGETAVQWTTYMRGNNRSKIDFYSLPYWKGSAVASGETYWNAFQEFLEDTGRNIDDYNVIIAPEYVRGGIQVCVRDKQTADRIQTRFLEYDTKPVWVRVYDGKGVPIDVNINDARNSQENIEYVKQRFRTGWEKFAEYEADRAETTGAGGPPQSPTVSPGAKGVAWFLVLIELSRYVLETASAIKNMPSALEEQLWQLGMERRFWTRYGIKPTILAIVRSGKAKSQGTSGVPDGTLEPAQGRILWGFTAEDWSKAKGKDLSLFLGFVDNFGAEPKFNALDSNIKHLLSLIQFLTDGHTAGLVVPWEKEGRLPASRVTEWWVRLWKPRQVGAADLERDYYSITYVVDRIRQRVLDKENARIARATGLSVPAGSRLTFRAKGYLAIDKSRVLRYKNAKQRPFYSVMTPSGGVDDLGDEDEWGSITPSFYQVGDPDVGSPFYIAKGLLVTGADADTNALLYSVLAKKERAALVAEYEDYITSTVTPRTPKDYVEAPVVYVEETHVS